MRRLNMERKLISFTAAALVICGVLATPVLAALPLENPETAKPAFSGVALFSYYSGSLDFVIEKAPSTVESRLEKMPFANVPPTLDQATEEFASATIDVAQKVVDIDAGIERLKVLVAQSRFDEARQLVAELTGAVSEANGDLTLMEQSVRESGQVFQVASAPEGSDLRQTYDEVLDKIDRIRQMLALDLDIINNMSTAIPGGSGDGSDDGSLIATELTLQIAPQAAFVGDTISLQGILRTDDGEALVGRQVDILLSGSQYAGAVTGSGGFYQGSLQVPYWYVPQISVQALYYPRGSDVGLYIASLSPEVVLQVMFYEATLNLAVAEEAYPGLDTEIAGVFDYGQSPVPDERRVEIYLDNELLASFQAPPEFSRRVAIPSDVDLGEHVITVSAQATGRYSAVVATAGLTVTRMTPVVDLKAPRVVLVPWSTHFSGTVRSDSGPLGGAAVKMDLRRTETEVASSSDGTFEAGMKMGWGFDLFGTDQLQVEVIPQEPWNEPVVVTRNVFVVNVVNCGGLLVILSFLAIYVPYRLKRRLDRRPSKAALPTPQPVEPAPAYGAQAAPIDLNEEASTESAGQPRERILRWYSLVLKLVQRITRVALRPDQTLREFTRETEAALGPIAKRLMEFTRLAERLLYSRHEPSEQDVEKTRRLSRGIEKGLGGEAE
ncbi:MAG: DUF4129 domain-containing protein [Dehalococcoidia bacterium]|nr:DUF4129 domain-containing protein [Dehalococcoidia bacterium]